MATTRCHRHAHVWMAHCPDCTAWHLDRLGARRPGAGAAVSATPSAPSAHAPDAGPLPL